MKDEKKFSDNRNFWLLVVGTSIFQFGWAMPTIVRIPYFNWLGMSNSQIGLTGVAWGLCIIGNFFCPALSRHFPRKKWFQFFITLPYLLADFGFGLSIVIAYQTNNYGWLIPVSLFLAFLWPFAAGWYVVPLSEYTANCISKSRIGNYVTTYQFGGAVMGFAGSLLMTYLMGHLGTPHRYAFGFLCAFGIAFLANMLPLLAHETPSPQPPPESFWKPAVNAVRHDKGFSRFLIVAFILWLVVLFPQLFMQMFAIREMGMPDQIAAVWASVYTGATMIGAALTGLGNRMWGYVNSLLAAALCFVFAMGIYSLPWSAELQEDSYICSWTVQAGNVIAQEGNQRTATENTSFVITGSQLIRSKDTLDLQLQFNRDVSAASFNEYDVRFKGPAGERLQVVSVEKTNSFKTWNVRIKRPEMTDGRYWVQITPYVQDVQGGCLDMNGNGKSVKDHYRFVIVGFLYGLSFIGLSIGLEALMYLLAPIDRRAGYFAAFRIIQFGAPTLAFYASGLCFAPGNYKTVFMILLISALAVMWIARTVLKPVRLRIQSASNQNSADTNVVSPA
jgi:MFS family permease